MEWSRRYEVAIRHFLKQGKAGNLLAAVRLGHQAEPLGLETLDVARIHEWALNTVTPSEDISGNAGQELLERAGAFFNETIVPIEATHRAARKADIRIEQLTRTLRRRAAQSSASDEQLEQAVAQREAVEANADARAVHHDKLQAEAQRIQKCLREQMRGILVQQEGERIRIGGELRDEVAQALLAIDLSLLALKTAGHANTDETEKSLADARRIL